MIETLFVATVMVAAWLMGFLTCAERVRVRVFGPWRERMIAATNPQAFYRIYDEYAPAWDDFVRATVPRWLRPSRYLLLNPTLASPTEEGSR